MSATTASSLALASSSIALSFIIVVVQIQLYIMGYATILIVGKGEIDIRNVYTIYNNVVLCLKKI